MPRACRDHDAGDNALGGSGRFVGETLPPESFEEEKADPQASGEDVPRVGPAERDLDGRASPNESNSSTSNRSEHKNDDFLIEEQPAKTMKRKLSAEDLAHFQQLEESRVVLDLDADVNEDIETGGSGGLQLAASNESMAEDTAFGLPQVDLNGSNGIPRRASVTASLKVVVGLAMELKQHSNRALGSSTGPQAREIIHAQQKYWASVWETVSMLAMFLDAIYVLVSVPFRIGFLFDPWDNSFHRGGGDWSQDLTILTVLDIAGELCRWRFTWKIIKGVCSRRRKQIRPSWISRKGSSTNNVFSKAGTVRPARGSLFSVRGDGAIAVPEIPSFDGVQAFVAMADASSTGGAKTCWPPTAIALIGIIPFELVAVFTNYNWLHIARCGKLCIIGYSLIASYSGLLLKMRRLPWLQWLSFSTLATPFYLFWMGIYLCHISACGYMLIATIECGLQSQYCVKSPIPGSWVLKDNMEHALLWRRYVRTMYWASKTVTTLGQGDLVPATQMETNYCVIVQFISGLWATAFLASCSFYFSRRDRDIENGVSTRLQQALLFLRSRKVPSTLSIQIRNYYQHIQRTRNGIEEEQVLSVLPAHFQFQCAFFVKYRLLEKVPFFSKQPKAFLRTLVDALDGDFLSPKDTVVALFDVEELIIVARGAISVLDQQRELVKVLSVEEWFAENALFEETRSPFELEAKTFCEIYRLPRLVFIACMEKHFAKFRIATVIAQQQQRRQAMVPPRAAQPVRPTLIMPQSTNLRKTLLQRLSFRGQLDSLPWRHPASRFRRRWRRWKVVFLLFLAVQVPFEISFKWRHGYFGQGTSTGQQATYLLSALTEMFFYADLCLRASQFYRRGSGKRRKSPSGETGPIPTEDVLVTTPRDIFQEYLSEDDVVCDVLSTVPISMIWICLNNETYSIMLREMMRFARLLALGRLLALKPTMKKIMVQIDLSPASQLLASVIVFCVITANAMACYFYLLADDKDFVDALPYGFDPDVTPVTGAQCLEQTTLYGNCTWFMYDKSVYSIDARYIRSMHWSLVLLSTVGYGDILSFTNSECLLGFWWIFFGAVICYFTSCAVGSVITQVMVLRTARDSRVEETVRALVRSDVSPSTQAMIRSHYEANWELNGSVVCEESLMMRLPRSLRHQLSSSLYLHSIRQCYVFAGFGGQLNILREVALAMTSSIVLPGFPIVECGHLSDHMHLVQSGEVEVLLPLRLRNGSVVSTKKMGYFQKKRRHFFGQEQLRRWSGGRLFAGNDMDTVSAVFPTSSSNIRSRRHRDENRLHPVPVAVLKAGDCFGEEGLLPHERYALLCTVRALTSTQVAVVHRNDFLRLADRFPVQLGQMIALIMKRYEDNQLLFNTTRANLEQRDKVREYLGTCRSVYVERASLISGIITTDWSFYRVWHAVSGLILVYNFYQITFRLAFLPTPSTALMTKLTVVDYLIDAFLYADIYLKWNRFGFEQYGEQVTDLVAIRRRYQKSWLKLDCWSMLPLYYHGHYFIMTLTRLPRLLKSVQLFEHIEEIELVIRKKFMKGSTTLLSVFDLFKFLVFFLSAAHHVGSTYFLLGRLLTAYNFASASWMTVDPIIKAHPGDILVQYNRAIYWCLETFTVVCFGDVIAQNSLETIFASTTCIIGWMCIGQVVGRITSLMASIDMDTKEHNLRVDNFEQYARIRKLPQFLRERAIESVEYKSKNTIELKMRSIFEDLPQALHVILFEELHGEILRDVPELAENCSANQIRVLANAFKLEIFVADDIIIEEGRLGTKLFVMKEGRAEQFSAQSRVVFAAIHEGVLFGDLAFFLHGTRHIASVRASRSCQVLQLDRRVWSSLWSEEARLQLEAKIVPGMRAKYRSVSRAFLNIVKNLELSIQGHANSAPHPVANLHLLSDVNASTRSMGSDAFCSQAEHQHPSKIPSKPGFLHRLIASITGVGKVSPASSTSTFTLFKKHKKRRSVRRTCNQRKLSGVLGIKATHNTRSSNAVAEAENTDVQWQRHERNLRVLKFIDNRHEQVNHSLQVRAAQSGNMDVLEPDDQLDVAPATPHKPPPVPPRTGGPPAALALSAMKHRPTKAGDRLAKAMHQTGGRGGGGKRHSIQVDRTDLSQAFKESIDDQPQLPTTHSNSPKSAKPVDSHIAEATSTGDAAHGSVHSSTLSQVMSSAMHAVLHPTKTPSASVVASASVPSSGSTRSETDNTPSMYVQHLNTLKMHSQRRQRRSVFAVVHDDEDEVMDETKNPYEIWLEPPSPPSFCLENSKFRRVWNTIMYLICLYYILVVPFRVSFDYDGLSHADATVATTVWFSLEYAMDLLCVVDFVLHNHYFAFVHRGTLVTEAHAIHEHYLHDGTLIADLFCIVPFEALIPLMPFLSVIGHSKVTWYRIAVFRLNKTIRIVHLHALGDKIQRTLVYDLAIARTSVIYFLRFAFDFALGAHWVAGLFYGAAFTKFDQSQPSWLTTAGMLTFEGRKTELQVGQVPLLMKYSRSYHFSMGAITTVSYGDIAPQNPWETLIATFVIVISIVLFGMLSGGFNQVFEMELGKRADYEEKISSVAHFMVFHRFPARIWQHMQSYFMVHWSESQGMNEDELLSGLPQSVKNDITLFVKQDFVKQMKLFASCDEAFVRAVVVAFEQELFVRNDVIITFGERGRRSLYVIERGTVLLRVPKKVPDAAAAAKKQSPTTFSQGASDFEFVKGRYDFFGEKSLIFDIPRSATCIALSSCSMLILPVDKYEDILEEFPEYRERNTREWIFANARENTPASAIRSPEVAAAQE